MFQHLIHRHVTRLGQPPAQLLQIEALAGLHHQAVFVEIDPGAQRNIRVEMGTISTPLLICGSL